MARELTSSILDRQNILNNSIAIAEIQERADIKGIVWNNSIFITKDMVANYLEVDIRTINRYIESNKSELTNNGYRVIQGKHLADFKKQAKEQAHPYSFPLKTTMLGIFDFRAFLNMAMLIQESEKARTIRQLILDIVIDLINRKTGGGTKYINKRDENFYISAIQENNYRRKFTDTIKDYVEENRYKYSILTDLIYVSIFKEKSKEYKKILDLKATDKVRETFYSEILDLIAAYENGLAEEIKKSATDKNRRLTLQEVKEILVWFESLPLWEPLMKKGRKKMASRDMALREAFHYRLAEYIQPLDEEEYTKFLGTKSDEFEKILKENEDVLKRLKERE